MQNKVTRISNKASEDCTGFIGMICNTEWREVVVCPDDRITNIVFFQASKSVSSSCSDNRWSRRAWSCAPGSLASLNLEFCSISATFSWPALRAQRLGTVLFVCLFGEGTHARSDIAEKSCDSLITLPDSLVRAYDMEKIGSFFLVATAP